jgi:hypothetical protein
MKKPHEVIYFTERGETYLAMVFKISHIQKYRDKKELAHVLLGHTGIPP